MKAKKFLALILALMLVLGLVSCSNNEDVEFTSGTTGDKTSNASPESDESSEEQADNSNPSNVEDAELIQFEAPEKGETIAVFTTNYGVIKMRLFPEEAPLAVENFETLISEGYYDGITFHRVINDFMIQGGDPTGTGSGGESCWGEDFDIELSKKLFNFRGALSMANTGMPTSNSSQFFIVQAPTVSADYFDMLAEYGYPVENIPENVKQKYVEVGGYPSLDANYYPEDLGMLGYTVFGQVFEGMEVVDAIAAVETDDSDKPLEDVVIEKAELVEYDG